MILTLKVFATGSERSLESAGKTYHTWLADL